LGGGAVFESGLDNGMETDVVPSFLSSTPSLFPRFPPRWPPLPACYVAGSRPCSAGRCRTPSTQPCPRLDATIRRAVSCSPSILPRLVDPIVGLAVDGNVNAESALPESAAGCSYDDARSISYPRFLPPRRPFDRRIPCLGHRQQYTTLPETASVFNQKPPEHWSLPRQYILMETV
jgi:hypothetical protein